MNRSILKRYLLFFLLFAVCGYFREFFFVHINNIMYMKYYQSESALKVPLVMQPFESLSYATLYYSKYLFTLLWVIVFYAVNYFALKQLADTPVFTRILLYAYALMMLLAGLSMGYGYLINERLQADEYTLSRWLMGVAQSPIISLILLASERLYKKQGG